MSQHDYYCKRHHRHHRSKSHGYHKDEKQQAAENTQKSQCELVNKIASIDIWATERLFEKWRRQVISQRRLPIKSTEQIVAYSNNSTKKSCLRHGGIAIGSGSKYFKARLAAVRNPKLQKSRILDNRGKSGGDTQPLRHKCKREHLSDLKHQMELEKLRKANRQLHKQYLSCSSETKLHSHCKCHIRHNRMHHESREPSSSENDSCEGTSSTFQTTAPTSGQQSASSDSSQLPIMQSNEDLLRKKMETSETPNETPMSYNPQQQFRSDRRLPENQSTKAKHELNRPNTVEALVTIDSQEPMDVSATHHVASGNLTYNGQKRWNCCEPGSKSTSYNTQSDQVECHGKRTPTIGCQWSNSSTRPTQQRKRSLSSDRLVEVQLGQRSIDQSTYNIVESISCSTIDMQPKEIKRYNYWSTDTISYSYNIAEVCKTELGPFERVCKLPKPTIYLMTARSPARALPSSGIDESTVYVKGSAKNQVQATSSLNKRKKFPPRNENKKVPNLASKRSGVQPFTGNNSVDGKSLLMLSPTTDECETKSQNSESLIPALVSNVEPMGSTKVARTSVPEVKMQSNATTANGTVDYLSEEDFESLVIHTEQETGDLTGIEPKTGSVSRNVQNAVLDAAGLLAAKGFAGLVGLRASQKEEEEEEEEENNDSSETWGNSTFKSMVTVEDVGNDKIVAPSLGFSEEDTIQTVVPQDETAVSVISQRRSKAKSRQGGDEDGDEQLSVKPRGRPGDNTGSKRLLPMTACPITQHRIECYRTQSGRVKCYMTARHPVKCQVRGNRIVCKATLKQQTSDLPYPCNAAWQCD